MQKDRQKFVLFPFFLVLYEVSNYLSNDAYLPALPDLANDLHINNNLAQLTLTAFFMGTAIMQLFFGPIADRVGRRPVLFSSGLIFIPATVICAVTSDIHLFLIARFAQGTAVTAMLVAGYATVHELFDQKQAIQTLAWMGGITVLAPAFGPLLGAFILLFGEWRLIFMILAVWASLALLGLFKVMPETCTDFKPIHFKSLMKAYGRVIANADFIRPVLALSSLFALMIAWIAAGPFLVMEKFGHSAMVFGSLQALIFCFFIIGARIVNKIVNNTSIDKIIKFSLTVPLVSGLVSILLSYLWAEYLFDIIVPMMGIALGCGVGFPVLNRMAIEASKEAMGVRMSVFSSLMGVSGMVGSAIISSSFFKGEIIEFAYILFIFCLFAALLYVRKLHR